MARSTRRTPAGPGRRASASGRRPQGRGAGSVGGGPRSSVRPGSAAPQRGGSGGSSGRFAKSSTKRLAILAGILVVLALMLVPTLRGYLSQRAQIEALEEEVAQRTQAVDQLGRELSRWDDPAFVEQEARRRLKFVRPGETSYQVLDAEGLSGSELAAAGSVVRPNEAAGTTWYGRVWSSLDAADSLSPKDVNAPLAPISPDSSAPSAPVSGAPASSGTGTSDGGTGASGTDGTDERAGTGERTGTGGTDRTDGTADRETSTQESGSQGTRTQGTTETTDTERSAERRGTQTRESTSTRTSEGTRERTNSESTRTESTSTQTP